MMNFLIFLSVASSVFLIVAIVLFLKSCIDLKKAEKYCNELFDEFTK